MCTFSWILVNNTIFLLEIGRGSESQRDGEGEYFFAEVVRHTCDKKNRALGKLFWKTEKGAKFGIRNLISVICNSL